MRIIVVFFRRFVFQYWMWFVGGVLALIATNWLTVQIPLQLAIGIDALQVGKGQSQIILSASTTIALMGLAIIVVRSLSRVLFFTPGRLVEFQMKNEMFRKLLSFQPAFYTKWRTGDIISRTSNDMAFLRVMTGFGALQIVNVSVALLFTMTEMFRISVSLSLRVLIPIVFAILLVSIGIRFLFDLTVKSREQLSDLSDHILSSVQGVQTIQGFNASEAFVSKFLDRNKRYINTNLKLVGIRIFVLPLLVLAGGISVWIVLLWGGPMVERGELSIGQLIAMTTFIAYLLVPLRSLGWLISVFQRGVVSLERLLELLDTTPERPEGDSPVAFKRAGGPRIEIRDLNFAYPDEPERVVLKDISLDIPAGAMVGVFGRTGSGKSTFIRLLSRIYNPPEGTVFIDGIDVTKVDLGKWRKRLGIVPQSPFLFSESVRENITMGEEDSEHLEQILDKSALRKDLEILPDGLDTVVGERGIMLSGGQRQRTSLARALYRSFDVLLLDDVLSAVDHKTERILIKTLEDLLQSDDVDVARPTSFLVSHRLSALVRTDFILVFEEGRLSEVGTHKELLEKPGSYREAWLHQSK